MSDITKCRMCGKLMRTERYRVYQGDPSCCGECNRKADANEPSDRPDGGPQAETQEEYLGIK